MFYVVNSIVRRVHRYELALKDRQAAINMARRGETRVLLPVTWVTNEGWQRERGVRTSVQTRVLLPMTWVKNEGWQRERGVRTSVQQGKVGYLLVQSDRRETTAILEGVRSMSDWNTYGALSEGKVNGSSNA